MRDEALHYLELAYEARDQNCPYLSVEPTFATYEPHAQRPWTTMSVVIRTGVASSGVTDAVRRRIREAGGDVPVYDFTTLNERIADSLQVLLPHRVSSSTARLEPSPARAKRYANRSRPRAGK